MFAVAEDGVELVSNGHEDSLAGVEQIELADKEGKTGLGASESRW